MNNLLSNNETNGTIKIINSKQDDYLIERSKEILFK